jgi:hypothetical protein
VSTVHTAAAEALLEQWMTQPGGGAMIVEARRRLRNGFYPTHHVRIIGQTDPRAGSWPLEQVAAFLFVHAGLGAGKFVQVDIEMHEAPRRDAERAANAAVLADLPAPFSAALDMEQNCSPRGDGTISWNAPIIADRGTGVGQEVEQGVQTLCEEFAVRPASGIPLEVGSTTASTTAVHLALGGAVARWPYRSTVVSILLDAERYAAAPDEALGRPMTAPTV